MELVIVQIGLIFSVLLVGIYHLYLDQFSQPKSDIQTFSNPKQLDYGPVDEDNVELYFDLTANNRGDDNGYVDFGEIVRFEFSNTDEFIDPDQYDANKLSTPSGHDLPRLPRITLKKDDEPTQILVPKGEVVEFAGVCRIYTDDLKELYSEYYSMRAVIEFQCRDNHREYKRQMTTSRIDIWRDYEHS